MPADETCPGPCNNRYRRAWALYDIVYRAYAEQVTNLAEGAQAPGEPRAPDIQPSWGDPVWCAICHAMIRAHLADLDELAAALAAMPPGIRAAVERRHEGVRVSGSHGVPSPSPNMDTLDELAGWLRAWEGIARGDDSRPRRGDLSTEITAIVGWLVSHLDPLLARRDVAPDFGVEVFRWFRELVNLTHSGVQAKHVKQECPACHKFTLWETPGETYVECVNQTCQARRTREELAAAA